MHCIQEEKLILSFVKVKRFKLRVIDIPIFVWILSNRYGQYKNTARKGEEKKNGAEEEAEITSEIMCVQFCTPGIISSPVKKLPDCFKSFKFSFTKLSSLNIFLCKGLVPPVQ